jgi:hypothetical protein
MSGSLDRHREADGGATLLETFIVLFRRFFVTALPSGLVDVLWHACADVCLPVRIRGFLILAATVPAKDLTPKSSTLPPAVRIPSFDASSIATTSTRIPVLSP